MHIGLSNLKKVKYFKINFMGETVPINQLTYLGKLKRNELES